MTTPRSMQEYALAKTSQLLDDVLSTVKAAQASPDMESIHKMRVAIRRFQQALRLFRVYLKKRGVREIKDGMRAIMKVAGELRNYDIASGLVNEAASRLAVQRQRVQEQLSEVVRSFSESDAPESWHARLGLRQQ